MTTTYYKRARGWVLDLARNVRNTLQPEHGGTGNSYAYGAGIVLPFSNGAGATLAIGTLVKLKGTYDDNRVIATTSASDPLVVGVVVGSYVDDDGINFQRVAPADNVQAAVMVAGQTYVTITGSVTRNQYAFSSSTSGAATSSGTFGSGAFGLFLESSSSGSALVVLGTAGASGGGTVSYGTPAIVLGTAAAAGAASTALRTDATIVAFDATTPAALSLGGSGAVGAAAVAARRDHGHAVTGALDALSDVTAPTPASGDKLVYNGSAWVNQSPSADTYLWRPLTDGQVPVDGAGVLPNEFIAMNTQRTTTSATLEDITGATVDVVFPRAAYIYAVMTAPISCSGASAVLGLAININGTDEDESDVSLAASTAESIATCIYRSSAPLAAGTYTIKGRFRRVSGSGTPAVDRVDLMAMVERAEGAGLIVNSGNGEVIMAYCPA